MGCKLGEYPVYTGESTSCLTHVMLTKRFWQIDVSCISIMYLQTDFKLTPSQKHNASYKIDTMLGRLLLSTTTISSAATKTSCMTYDETQVGLGTDESFHVVVWPKFCILQLCIAEQLPGDGLQREGIQLTRCQDSRLRITCSD